MGQEGGHLLHPTHHSTEASSTLLQLYQVDIKSLSLHCGIRGVHIYNLNNPSYPISLLPARMTCTFSVSPSSPP